MGMHTSRFFAVTSAVVMTVGAGVTLAAQNRDTVKVPGGLALSECMGYEDWPSVSVSQPENKLNAIVANPTMIAAYRSGIPGNGKPFPDGSKTVKIGWKPELELSAPFKVYVPAILAGVGCMVKDSARFPDTGGWGYAEFDYDATSDRFVPNTKVQGNNAKCGAECHQAAKSTDFVFTAYGKR